MNAAPGDERGIVLLRDVLPADVDVFFEQQLDDQARWMAAFIGAETRDPANFRARWERIPSDTGTVNRTIVADGAVAGYVAAFTRGAEREVSYWLGSEFWRRGIATQALRKFLEIVTERPLFARAAADNSASLRVLEKCGFRRAQLERGYADARGAEITEWVLKLE